MPDRRGFFASPKSSQRPDRPVHGTVSRGLRLHARWLMRQLPVPVDQMAPSFCYGLPPTAPKVRRSRLVLHGARPLLCQRRSFLVPFFTTLFLTIGSSVARSSVNVSARTSQSF